MNMRMRVCECVGGGQKEGGAGVCLDGLVLAGLGCGYCLPA